MTISNQQYNRIIDLHSHTNASDGTYTPSELVDYAATKALSALAVTDHDTIAGLAEAKEQAKKYPDLEIISGIEFSTHSDICKSDIHILGYYINEHDKIFQTKLKSIVDARLERNDKMIARMQAAGMNISLDDVYATSDDGIITRAHFAKAMENLGIVKKMSKAFEKYIGNGKPFYVERDKVTQKMAIEMIIENGGVPVLAHPVLYGMNLKTLSALCAELKSYGLVGIEGIYTTYKTHETQYIARIAEEQELIVTGGSDFHGAHKPGIDLAVGYGQLAVPYSIREELHKAHKNILNR